jgi:hypothetical protein
MAVVQSRSPGIANTYAVPPVLNNSIIDRAQCRLNKDFVQVAFDDSIASILRILQVPSNARIDALRLSNSAVTSAAGSVGVYRNTRDGGAVVSVNYFATGASLAVAQTNIDITNQSGLNTIIKQVQPLWQALGLASDPNTTFDIAVTLTAAATVAGQVSLSATLAE